MKVIDTTQGTFLTVSNILNFFYTDESLCVTDINSNVYELFEINMLEFIRFCGINEELLNEKNIFSIKMFLIQSITHLSEDSGKLNIIFTSTIWKYAKGLFLKSLEK